MTYMFMIATLKFFLISWIYFISTRVLGDIFHTRIFVEGFERRVFAPFWAFVSLYLALASLMSIVAILSA